MNLTSFKDKLSQDFFGRTKSQAQEKRICVICGKPATDFRDKVSLKEYAISGLCQECQDATFQDK